MVRGVVGDRNIHPLLGWGILALVLWHGITLVTRLAPDYLCSVCFIANAILAAGLIIGSGLMIGIGFGWAVIGLPLWAFHVWIAGDVLPSSVALHLIGCSVGFVGVRAVPPPRWLVLVALPVGICACLLARFLTHPCYNVNAVFRVQEGWGGMFPEHRMYLLTQGVAYALVFLLVPAVGRRKACLCEGAAS